MSAASAELRATGVANTGFVTPEGQFLDRQEALAWVNANGENIKPSPSMEGELDALDYREQSAFARRGGDLPDKPRVPKGQPPPPPKGEPFADPEVAALAADTEAALLREGLDPADIAAATPPAQDPQTVADAVAAGAFCLRGGG